MNNALETGTLEILRKTGVLKPQHYFLDSTGRHLDEMVDMMALYPYVGYLINISCSIVMHFYDERGIGVDYDAVVGVGEGGPALAFAAAYDSVHRQKGKEQCLALWTSYREDGEYFVRPMAELLKGRKVLIVMDLLDDASRVVHLVELIQNSGGEVRGVGTIVKCNDVVDADIPVPEVFALCTIETWTEDQCPVCNVV